MENAHLTIGLLTATAGVIDVFGRGFFIRNGCQIFPYGLLIKRRAYADDEVQAVPP
mgnify:FL=1